jgi:hypothetical protein
LVRPGNGVRRRENVHHPLAFAITDSGFSHTCQTSSGGSRIAVGDKKGQKNHCYARTSPVLVTRTQVQPVSLQTR